MSMITSPSNLNLNTEVSFNTTSLTIALNMVGNLSTDGVTMQALYSFIYNVWKSDDTLITFPIPILAITSEQYEIINGWSFVNDSTRKLIRNSGWAELDSSGNILRSYIGLTTLGDISSGLQVYYQQVVDGNVTNTTYTGKVNEAIQIYGDADNGNFDYTDYLKIFIREAGYIFDDSDNIETEISVLDYRKYSLPLSTKLDLDILTDDSTIASTSPWNGITLTCYDTPVTRNIDGVDYYFDCIIDGNSGTLQQIYEKIQYLLRQNSDIDEGAGTLIGKSANLLLEFIGDNLHTSTGVYIDNFQVAESSYLYVYDNTGTHRPFPISVVLSISGLVSGSYVGIFDNEIVDLGNNNTLLDSVESSGSVFSFEHNGSSNEIVIVIMCDGYEEQKILYTLNSNNQTINIVQKLDNN